MIGVSRMFDQTICRDTHNAISLPELESGHSLFDAPDGLMIDLFGQVPVRANLSARQAKDLRLLTSGTYGPPSSTSSASADLQRSLESRFLRLLSMDGGT